MYGNQNQFRRVRGWWLVLLLGCPLQIFALSSDESQILDRARAIAAAPLDDFSVFGETCEGVDAHYRYQIAFIAYGLCSVVTGAPELRDESRTLFVRLVEKMERPETLAYWKEDGFEGDGLRRDNAMYRGHLNLMYGLAHDRFGETKFDERFHALSRTLFDELGSERPICCEPDRLFVQCNAVTVLSLFLHDRVFGTSYGSAGKKLLAWARERMPLEGTCLVRECYRPSTGKSSAQEAGYANAWTIAFLAPVPGLDKETATMYADWRRTFVEPIPPNVGDGKPMDRTLWLEETFASSLKSATFDSFGIVRGAPAGEELSLEETLSSGLPATTFGLLAARAEGDEILHRRLSRTVACVESMAGAFENLLPPKRRIQARTFCTIALFARTFRGWNEVLGVTKSRASENQ
jgi:hypothetical protein